MDSAFVSSLVDNVKRISVVTAKVCFVVCTLRDDTLFTAFVCTVTGLVVGA